jgi:hypothetical protein
MTPMPPSPRHESRYLRLHSSHQRASLRAFVFSLGCMLTAEGSYGPEDICPPEDTRSAHALMAGPFLNVGDDQTEEARK